MRKAPEKPLLTLFEASKVSNMPVTTPLATVCEITQPDENQCSALIEAIATVKAAGYRVSKPRKPKIFKRGRDRVGPTYVAKFADGSVTRMSVSTSLEKLDWDRGERLSQAAYRSRFRTHNDPPAIIAAHFEQDGVVLAQRGKGSVP